jgi:hypothetical protein
MWKSARSRFFQPFRVPNELVFQKHKGSSAEAEL